MAYLPIGYWELVGRTLPLPILHSNPHMIHAFFLIYDIILRPNLLIKLIINNLTSILLQQ